MKDPAVNFQALYALGSSGYGSSEVGEVSVGVNAANANGGGLAAYSEAFRALGNRTAVAARDARAQGHLVTARDRFLRAAEYYAQALFFVLATKKPQREPVVFATMKHAWEQAGALFNPPIEKVAIPYEGGSMPGYFLRPDQSTRPRPTVIVNNGSDGQSIEVYPFGPAAAVERGWNALILEGPGQGAMLFERMIPFRPDWEKVIGPVIDYLESRPDVDHTRIALTGWSMGGELVARAAAYEPRLAAIVTDPGSINTWRAWPKSIRRIAQAGEPKTVNRIWRREVVPHIPRGQEFLLRKRGEIYSKAALLQARQGITFTDFAAVAAVASKLRLSDREIKAIQMPVLVVDYQFEAFYPGQAAELYARLSAPHKEYAHLTSAIGAQYHCAPMAPQRRNEVVFDWLDQTVGHA